MAVATTDEILSAAAEVLGPLPLLLADVITGLEAAGLDLGPNARAHVIDALQQRSANVELDSDRWLALDRALDGTTWATVAEAALVAEDSLEVAPDLELVAICAVDDGLPLAGADASAPSLVEFDDLDEPDLLVGPDGWLAHCVGQPIGVTLRDGTCSIEVLDALPEPSAALVELLRSVFETHCRRRSLKGGADGQPVEVASITIDELLCEAIGADRARFTDGVVPRLDDILERAELQRRDVVVITRASRWESYDHLRRREQLAELWDLDDDEVDEAELLLASSYGVMSGGLTLESFGEGEPAPTDVDGEPRTGAPAISFFLALCLVKDKVARAFVGEHIEHETDPADLAAFARELLQHLDAPEDTGVRWLLAWALNQTGDALGAEAELERAQRSGLDHVLMLRDLAGFRSDRGDAVGAMALLARAVREELGDEQDPDGVDVDIEIEMLLDEVEDYAQRRPAAPVSRNDPCPCGSGRKYKACHLGTERHPLEERAPWLYEKARRFLRQSPSRTLGLRLAAIATDIAEGDGSMFVALVEAPLLTDVALHEGGVFADFLAQRDALLPDDEALTAAQWALTDRSLFEIAAMPDGHLVLRDLRSGDERAVVYSTPPDGSRVGGLLLGRPLPVGDTWRALSGFIDVREGQRDAALELLDGDPDPFAVAAFIGACITASSATSDR